MTIRTLHRTLFALALCVPLAARPAGAQAGSSTWSVASPDGHVRVELDRDAGSGLLTYAVSYLGSGGPIVAVAPSPLGIVREDARFTRDLRLVSQSRREIDETYSLLHGKTSRARAHANELTLSFANPAGERVDVVVRAYPEGAAFRYRFPGSDTTRHTVRGELTSFRLPEGTTGWMLPHDKPGQYTPAYENTYRQVKAGSFSPTEAGWDFPALFHTPGGAWVLLTESGLSDSYAGTRMEWDPLEAAYRIRFPQPGEGQGVGDVYPSSRLPWETTWRVIEVGVSPGDIVESSLVTHLAAPAEGDFSWVRPGRASWSWWSASDSPRDPAALRSFYDLAAEMGWEYSLIDANWNLMPDDTIQALVDYGKKKGVKTILWYNSGGPHNHVTEQPRDRLTDHAKREAEFTRLERMGVSGVKVDFWQSDKQDRIQQYLGLIRDAAAHHLIVDTHGSTIPRGWERTYPNLVSMEAVHGAESYKFDANFPKLAPSRNVMLVFTRNAIGPMDFTPVTFSDAAHPHLTTDAHELALSVVFESGVQHFADRVEAYLSLPDAPKRFLGAVPAAWDETRLLSGDPSSYVVLARREGDDWYVGGISGEETALHLPVDLSFLGAGSYDLLLIRDGADPRSFQSQRRVVRAGDTIPVDVLPRGGFAMRITPRK
ncbi:MAG TPA: glycoside hydrolase family 97 catalytic domain-containing protein [Longimicrobiaceae bacterium]|nr:glycoside hydrolase family 97 catalytic domain-containing protein [Longimicrobiaceae bacterium]